MNTLKALKRCSLGLDLYLWLTYRTFALRAPLRLTWKQVYRQFGLDPTKASDKSTVRRLPYKVLRELKKIKLAWPDLNYSTEPGVLIVLALNPRHRTFGSSSTSKLGRKGSPLTAPRSRGQRLRFRPTERRSWGILSDCLRKSYPQGPVFRGSFPRLKRQHSFGALSPKVPTFTRETSPKPPTYQVVKEQVVKEQVVKEQVVGATTAVDNLAENKRETTRRRGLTPPESVQNLPYKLKRTGTLPHATLSDRASEPTTKPQLQNFRIASRQVGHRPGSNFRRKWVHHTSS